MSMKTTLRLFFADARSGAKPEVLAVNPGIYDSIDEPTSDTIYIYDSSDEPTTQATKHRDT